MVCLKTAHLGRVTYCFETLLFLCKLVFFNYNFHKNTRSRQKRFVSKQGQPWPYTQLKARLLTEQLKLHYSVHYCRLAILPIAVCKICFSIANMRNTPSSLIFIHPAPVLSYTDSKQTKQINSVKFVNSGFRTVVVFTSAPHAEGRQFKSGPKHFTFFFKWGKSVQST